MSEQAKRAFEAFTQHAQIRTSLAWEQLPPVAQEAWRAAVAAAIDTPPPAETLTGKQVRLLQEMKTAEIGKAVGEMAGPGRGFILFTFDYGPGGSLSYVASADRHDAIRVVREWLRQKGAL